MLNLNQLRVFHHVAKNLSFTAAARELFVTQPAVTAQMKLFETGCNLKFFKKRGRNIYLTHEGKVLFEYTRTIFSCEKEIESAIEDMRELKRGALCIGTTKTYARYFMPTLLSNFHKVYPQIKITLDEGSSVDMIHSLLEFKNEVAVIAKAEDNREVRFIPFNQEEIMVIMAPDYHLSRRETVTWLELAREPVIMKEIGSGTRKLVNEMFDGCGCMPNVLMETSNTELIKQLVMRGEGISFLVKAAVIQEISENKLATAPIGEKTVFLDVSFAYLKNQPLSPSARAFEKIMNRLGSSQGMPKDIGALMANILSQPW